MSFITVELHSPLINDFPVFVVSYDVPRFVILVFPSIKNHKFKSFDFRKPFEKSLKAAEIENFTWHCFRHSSASYHAMNGTPIKTMMELFGWKTEAMAHRYSHIRTQHKTEAQESMVEEFLGLEQLILS